MRGWVSARPQRWGVRCALALDVRPANTTRSRPSPGFYATAGRGRVYCRKVAAMLLRLVAQSVPTATRQSVRGRSRSFLVAFGAWALSRDCSAPGVSSGKRLRRGFLTVEPRWHGTIVRKPGMVSTAESVMVNPKLARLWTLPETGWPRVQRVVTGPA